MTLLFRDGPKVAQHATLPVRTVVMPEGERSVSKLAEEVPVAMVFNGTSVGVLMATPLDVQDFAIGFALSEGFISSLDDILDLELIAHENGLEARFWLNDTSSAVFKSRQRIMTGPIGCGLCGLDSLEQATRTVPALPSGFLRISIDDLMRMINDIRKYQPLHDVTRAAHAAGFIKAGKELACVREDVGRHNALDKLIGALAGRGTKFSEGAFVMTSRLSVELVQKSAVVGCPVVIAVSAPTGYAVRLAEEAGIALIAYSRSNRFEIFSHPERIIFSS